MMNIIVVLSSLAAWVPAAALVVMPINRSTVSFSRSVTNTSNISQLRASHPWGVHAFVAQGPTGDVQCDVFYKTGNLRNQKEMRTKNVLKAMKKFPQVRKFEVLSWGDSWNAARNMYQSLGINVDVNSLKRDSWAPAAKGMLSHWASLLLIFGFQVQFNRKCMVVLEDDLALPDDFDRRLSEITLPRPGNEVLWLQSGGAGTHSWGEGFVFTLEAAKHFLMTACIGGIKQANDRFILSHFKTKKVWLHTHRLVKAGAGNIKGSPTAPGSDFDYSKKPPLTCYSKLAKAFPPQDEELPGISLSAVAEVAFGSLSKPNWNKVKTTPAPSLKKRLLSLKKLNDCPGCDVDVN